MAFNRVTISGIAGNTEVYHPLLSMAEVMLVKRDGKIRFETNDDAPVNKQFKHLVSDGKIRFDASLPFEAGLTEIVEVLFKF